MNTCTQCGLNAELDNDDLCTFCNEDNLKDELATIDQYPAGLMQCHPRQMPKEPEGQKVA